MKTRTCERCLLAASLAAICLWPGSARPEEAEDVFQSLYGRAFRDAQATRTADDDIALAAKLLAAAKLSTDQPALLAVLCEKAWELACRDAAGFQMILDGDDLLAEHCPQQREASAEKLLESIEKLHRICKGPHRLSVGEKLVDLLVGRADAAAEAGDLAAAADLVRRAVTAAASSGSVRKDGLQARLQQILSLRKTLGQIEQLQETLKKDPRNLAAREKLIALHLIDMDDPASAAKLLSSDCSETLRTYVPLAAGKVESLAETVCLELAAWYETHAAKNPSAGVAMLLRARTYYEQYLQKHKAADLSAKKAELALTKITDALIQLAPAAGFGRPRFADKAVGAAFDKAVAFLWSAQRRDGSWPEYEPYDAGPTALVALALLEGGVSAKDPRMDRALKWLAQQETDRTYTLGLRCAAWAAASRTSPGTYSRRLRSDVSLLLRSTGDGSFTYTCRGNARAKNGDNSNSQFGLLGVHAGAQAKLPIPRKFWEVVSQRWLRCQKPDGGWSYTSRGNSTATMTTAGLFSVLVCLDHLGKTREAAVQVLAVRKALAWLEEHQPDGDRDRDRERWSHYYLYGAARAGEAGGLTKFGQADWFQGSVATLLGKQAEDGAWSDRYSKEISTAFAVLFLAKGSRVQPATGVEPK